VEPISASIAGVLALVGVLLLAYALFADRSKGRRRCPKCGYHMAGIEGRRCPECGKEAKSEKRLFKTRRHWRRAAAAVVLLIAPSLALAGWSRWEARGWAGVPDRALVLFTRLDNKQARTEASARIDRGGFDVGAWRSLLRRSLDDLDHPSAERSAFAGDTIDRSIRWVRSSWREDASGVEPLRRMIAQELGPHAANKLLRSTDDRARRDAVSWCSALGARSTLAKRALILAASDEAPPVAEVQRNAIGFGEWLVGGLVPDMVARQVSFGRLTWLDERIEPWLRDQPATDETMLTLAQHLITPDMPGAEHLRGAGSIGAGAGIILSTKGPTDGAFEAIIPLTDPSEHGVAIIQPIRLLSAFAWRDEMRAPLLAAIGHEDWEIRDAGWDVLEHFGEDAGDFGPELLAIIRKPGNDASPRAANAALAMGVPRDELRRAAIDVLRAQLDAWRAQRREPFTIDGRDIVMGGGVIDWVRLVVDAGDTEAVEILRSLVFDTDAGMGSRCLSVYAAVSGDGEGATRFALDAYTELIENERSLDRRTSARISSAARAIVQNPNADVDAIIAWANESTGNAWSLVQFFGFRTAGIPEASLAHVERMMESLLDSENEPVREGADRVLERIERQRQKIADEAAQPDAASDRP
jgi:hypothetical protein